MQVVTYTGNGSTQTIEVGFKVGLVWIKRRDSAGNNGLFDVVRGATNWITSNGTTVETSGVQGVTAFTPTGFTLGNHVDYNASGATYVAWCWRAGDTTVTNTTGTISSQVCANPDAGFSVVTYKGTGSNSTVGHGLGVVPAMILLKDRSNTYTWVVYHKDSNANPAYGYLPLNSTGGFSADTAIWNNTIPTSSVFSIGTPSGGTNINNDNYIAYCFAEIAGYSKFGRYLGNGSSDGIFVYLGFRPKYILIKHIAGTDDWWLEDSTRKPSNSGRVVLSPNASSAEIVDSNAIDFLSNGFKIRNAGTADNSSGEVYIYAAFAENPFNYSLAR